MKVNNLSPKIARICKPISTGKNVIVNVCNYTYNVAPRIVDSVKSGRIIAEEISNGNNHGRVKRFFLKRKEVTKSIFRNMNIFEVPVILSALAIPTTPPGGSPLAFVAGCLLISPIFIKKLATKELTFDDIKTFMQNLGKKDYIEINPKIKNSFKDLKALFK